MTAWTPFLPTKSHPWTARLAAHLIRRAGFGAPADEVTAAVQAGPEATVEKLLTGSPEPDSLQATTTFLTSEAALPRTADVSRLGAVWVARMLASTHPLREKLTLFWHDHFATSLTKVADARLMLEHYWLLHTHALGQFDTLVRAMTTDPAMMIWLDTTTSTRGKPNENYARELMELFTLGLGHHSEMDVREAARAFTGYTLAEGRAVFRAARHDDGSKTILGQTSRFRADDVVTLCLDHPACVRFLARKLYRFFVTDVGPIPDELEVELAETLRMHSFNIAAAVKQILLSEHFYSPIAFKRKVKSPVEFLIGTVRTLGGSPGALPLAEAVAGLGQTLFAPPSVKGWPGGTTWLTGQTLLARQNLALALVSGEDARFHDRCDPVSVVEGLKGTAAVDRLLDLLLQGEVADKTRQNLRSYHGSGRERIRSTTHLILSLPEYQLN